MSSEFGVLSSELRPGFYAVEITTKDKEGNEVKDVRHVELYDSKNNSLARPEYLWTKGSMSIEPGEKTAMQIGSTANNVFLIQQVSKSTETNRTNIYADELFSFATLNSEKKSFGFSATESDRGGYGVTYFFIKDNRFYEFNDIINVPWSNKE